MHMGMFDSIMMQVKCPYCGEEIERECQTKDLECILDVFRVGDTVGTDVYNKLTCICDCNSETCWNPSANHGYGMGRFFWIKVKVTDKKIVGEYEIERIQ